MKKLMTCLSMHFLCSAFTMMGMNTPPRPPRTLQQQRKAVNKQAREKRTNETVPLPGVGNLDGISLLEILQLSAPSTPPSTPTNTTH